MKPSIGQQSPLRAIVLAGVVLALTLTAGASVADAHPCCDDGPGGSPDPQSRWQHQHRLYYRFLNRIDSGRLRTEAEDARREWRRNTVLGFPRVSTRRRANIRGRDGNYGNVGWIGLARVCFHCDRSYFLLNKHYKASKSGWQGVACHEIGHLIGLDHARHGDCMGWGHFSGSSGHVGSWSKYHIRTYYPNPPDDSAPHGSK